MNLSLVSRDVPTSRHQPGPVALEALRVEAQSEGTAELVGCEGSLAVIEAREEPAAVLGVGVVT